MTNQLTATAYAPVRKCMDDGHEWIDYSAASCCLEQSQRDAAKADAFMGLWSKGNPIVRFANIRITEIRE